MHSLQSSSGWGILAAPSKRARRQTDSLATLKWPHQHRTLFEKKGLLWTDLPRLSDDDLMCFPGLCELSEREIEVLRYVDVACFPEVEMRVIDVSRSIHRCRATRGFTPTVLPGSRLYLTNKCRLMHPAECLRVQNLDFSQDLLGNFDPSLLQSLAGNAFDAGCCLAVIISTCVALARGAARSAVGSPVAGIRSPSPDSDHDDDVGCLERQ